MAIVWFIIILGTIILVHEFGHFLFAKLSHTYVYEFSIGMGPKLFHYKKKNGETEYCLRLIPLGGFVRLAGEEVDDDESIPKNRKLHSKSFIQRFLIMFAGAGFNFILAFIILFVSALIYGSTPITPVVDSVSEGSPAYVAGIQEGDRILSINNDKTSSWNEVQLIIQSTKGKELTVKLKDKDDQIREIKITPVEQENEGNKLYVIGVSMSTEKKTGFVNSLNYATNTTGALFKLMITTVKSIFTGGVSVNQLSGPIGIYTVVDSQAKLGFANILYLVAFLSINVGVINLIPFPAFDGGRILFLIIEKIKGSPVSPKVENTIHNIGFFLLMALMIYVTFNDVLRLF